MEPEAIGVTNILAHVAKIRFGEMWETGVVVGDVNI